jgi:hypothetical protein
MTYLTSFQSSLKVCEEFFHTFCVWFFWLAAADTFALHYAAVCLILSFSPDLQVLMLFLAICAYYTAL